MTVVAVALLVMLAGAAIGATSIGGVLVVPALTSIAGVPLASAVGASSFGFLVTGVWAMRHGRNASGPALRSQLPLHLAAFVGAAVGALLIQHVPAGGVRAWVALLALASGLHAFATAHRVPNAHRSGLSPGALAGLGSIVGAGSALSGTGGPVLLLPMLLLLGLPVAPSIAIAQAIQLPIAIAAGGTHLAAGTLDIVLGISVGAALLVGARLGHRVADQADPLTMRRAVALVLILTGVWYGLA